MSNTATSTHPVAIRNRINKAQRVVAFIDANPTIFSGVGTDVVATFGPETWSLINRALGETRPLSNLTIATVLGILAGREV